jgi:hypothetical protein
MSTWSEIMPQPCNPQSLLGYAKEAHRASQRTCLYCGLGVHDAQGDKAAFDTWRQFTLEHILPESQASRDRVLGAIRAALPRLGEAERLADWVVKRMNLATACHFCNSAVSHHKKKQQVNDAVIAFGSYLDRSASAENAGVTHLNGSEVRQWLEGLATLIIDVWRAKATVARGKVKWLALNSEEYREKMGYPLNWESATLQPGDLDGRLKKHLLSLCCGPEL